VDIRPSTLADIPRVVELALEYARSGHLSAILPSEEGQPAGYWDKLCTPAFKALATSKDSALLVAEMGDGRIVGFLAGVLAPFWFADVTVAQVLGIYVTPGSLSTRAGSTLMDAWRALPGVAACKIHAASAPLSSDGGDGYGSVLRHRNFKAIETIYMRGAQKAPAVSY
jgi:hypothetical protein